MRYLASNCVSQRFTEAVNHSVKVSIHKIIMLFIGLKSLLLECCQNLAILFQAQSVKYFAHRFLKISCSGPQVGGLSSLFGNLKLVLRPMWISNCKKSVVRNY